MTSAIDPEFERAGLVVIDTQRDVLDDGGFPIAGTSAALPAMRRVLDAFRAAGRPIVHIVRLYEQDGSNAELCRQKLLAEGARLVVRGSAGSEIPATLLPSPGMTLDAPLLLGGGAQSLGPGEVAMYKPRWGAFYRTELDRHLRHAAVSTVVFMGCNFPNCPRASIYEASERDYRIVVVRDAVSGLYERGERELEGIGARLMTADEVAGVITEGAQSAAVTR